MHHVVLCSRGAGKTNACMQTNRSHTIASHDVKVSSEPRICSVEHKCILPSQPVVVKLARRAMCTSVLEAQIRVPRRIIRKSRLFKPHTLLLLVVYAGLDFPYPASVIRKSVQRNTRNSLDVHKQLVGADSVHNLTKVSLQKQSRIVASRHRCRPLSFYRNFCTAAALEQAEPAACCAHVHELASIEFCPTLPQVCMAYVDTNQESYTNKVSYALCTSRQCVTASVVNADHHHC